MSCDVIVIGAGHNGLVAACYLARAGLDVVVLEAAGHIGGMTVTRPVVPEAPDHVFNLCAVDLVFMRMSTVIADLELRRFGYDEVECDPGYGYLTPDGDSIALWRDPRRTAEEIAHFSRRDAESFIRFARAFDALMTIAAPVMTTNPVRPDPRSVLTAAARGATNLRSLTSLAAILSSSAVEVIEERFEHPIVRSALDVLCSTAAPIDAPGSAIGFTYLGFNHRYGVARPIGGIGALPAALARCLEAAGGRLRISAPVESLLHREGRVTGVRLADGEELHARAVVSTADAHQTLTKLLPAGLLPPKLETRARHIPTGNQGAVFLKVDIACRGRLRLSRHEARRKDGLDLRIPFNRMGGSQESTLRAQRQSAAGLIPDEIPFGATVPTALDPTQAPPGQDTVYLYAWAVPKEPRDRWRHAASAVGERLVKEMAAYYDNLEEVEISHSVETVDDMAARTKATDGNVYLVDIRFSRIGPLRPARGLAGYRTPVPGLFLSGGSTHPGPGVSGIPGQLAARTVLKNLRS